MTTTRQALQALADGRNYKHLLDAVLALAGYAAADGKPQVLVNLRSGILDRHNIREQEAKDYLIRELSKPEHNLTVKYDIVRGLTISWE